MKKIIESNELFICYNYLFVDFKIISITQNFSQICSSFDTRSGISTIDRQKNFRLNIFNKKSKML